jgi:N-sulfoglucosamine sulfohydrolase
MHNLKTIALLATTLLASLSANAAPKNVLLYVVDDQGTNDAGCMGNPVIHTPGLDTLAAEGIRMEYAYCTTPSCSASRSVILSGIHNHANGQYGHQHSFHHFTTFDKIKTLPKRMSEAGYRTWSVGKYHVAPREVYPFDKYVPVKAPIEMAEISRTLIEEKSDDPFFLYFCTTEPHRPFKREGSQEISPEDVIVPDYLPDTPESRRELARYYMSVERADSGLKRLIEILKASGHWEDTLIIFISDNGIAFPGAKTNMYEPGVRLPCVIRDPRIQEQGGTSKAMITYADLAPTILDYADVKLDKKAMHGRSFLPALTTDDTTGRDEVFLSHTFHEITMYYPVRVLRERKYKLMWNIASGLEFPFASDLYASETWQGILKEGATHYGKRTIDAYLNRDTFELYDLENDPHEINNLAKDPDHAPILKQMQQKLKTYQKETSDPWISKWEYE